MEIPARLEGLLKQEDGLHGAILTTLQRFDPWFSDNRMVFFPGYTNHGIPHVQSVMRAAESLIREEAWVHLSAADSATCILSILLHDAAMHLSEDGFLSLISGSPEWHPKSRLFSETADWNALWDGFLTKASRFDEQKLIDLFGDSEPIGRPPENPLDWTDRHKLLIGEFLRIHHATLAHEIALGGVPGPGENRLALASSADWMRDLAGLIARSHNLNLRACADRMPQGGRKIWRHVHAPFLMGLLRVADYLEIQAPRAPAELLKVRSLRSPLSRQEWINHQAVFDVRAHEEDPECIWVDTEPNDVKTFMKLKSLFRDIQSELDGTWAVLGEIYGRDEQLRELGIRVRRIRSTLDDIASFEKTVAYIPVAARFRTADPEILKLMISPLYGDRPEFGIRELMQNSVDACSERADYLNQRGKADSELSNLAADVVITIEEEDDGGWISVEDRGIGMTREIILDYFLKAGASFRSSDEWSELHTGDSGPRIRRIGRFGVGLLGAFLLGNRIYVSTRHIREPAQRGIEFSCGLESQEIELRWTERPIGTTIRIRATRETIRELVDQDRVGSSWDWYTGIEPQVLRRVKLFHPIHSEQMDLFPVGELVDLVQGDSLPTVNSGLPCEWRRITSSDFDDVQWTWHGPRIVCNSVKITDASRGGMDGRSQLIENELWDSFSVRPVLGPPIGWPSLHVYDRLGKLPVNLTRTSIDISGWEMFRVPMLQEVIRDIIAFLLVRIPDSLEASMDCLIHSLSGIVTPRFIGKNEGLQHPAICDDFMRDWHWLTWSPIGIRLSETSTHLASPAVVWFFPEIAPVRNFPTRNWFSLVDTGQVGVLIGGVSATFGRENRINKWIEAALFGPPLPENPHTLCSDDIGYSHFGPWINRKVTNRALILPRARCSGEILSRYPDLRLHAVSDDLVMLCRDSAPPAWVNLEPLRNVSIQDGMEMAAVWKLDHLELCDTSMSPLGKAWLELMGHRAIPFDLNERQILLADVYVELSEEIARWRQAGTYTLAHFPANR